MTRPAPDPKASFRIKGIIFGLTYAALSAACFFFLAVSPSAAQSAAPPAPANGPPVFRLKGSDFSVTGSITSFDGKTFTVETANLGTVELSAQTFECTGPRCPAAPFTAAAPAAPKSVAANQTTPPPAAPAAPPPAKPSATPPAPAAATASPTAAPKTARRIAISGAPLIGQRLLPELIQAFASSTGAQMTQDSANPTALKFILTPAGAGESVEFDVRLNGDDQAFRDLERAAAQIVMTTRPIAAEEAARLAALGLGDFRLPSHERVLALDGLMVFVAPRNPAVALSIEDLAKILAGQTTDWADLKLPPGKINVYAAQSAAGGPDTLTHLLLHPRGLKLAATTQRTATNAELAERLARDPFGIGIGNVVQRPATKALTIGTSCGLIVKPSMFAVKTEEYPLSRSLYAYTSGEPADSALRAFLAFTASPDGQSAIQRAEFAGQDIQTLTFPDQTDRLAYALNAAPEDFDLKLARTMISELRSAQRMSLTLRFQTNTDQLTAKSLADMNQLISYLGMSANLTKRALLVGFSDSSGTFATNLRLSERRTAAVYRTLLMLAQGKIDPARISARSYGKLAPVACNDSLTHRALNRRVEIWLQN